MKRIFAILLLLCLTACYKEPLSSEKAGNDFSVEFLFEKDGIKVYRFYDGGRAHYFTSNGETFYRTGGKSNYEERIK